MSSLNKLTRKAQICALLKGIETGDPNAVKVVNESKYIQHNPQTHEGSEGLAELFQRLSKTSPRVNIVRAFEDGEYVFAHTEYDFSSSNIGFEIFRFEHGQAVEHWDNIQLRSGPNASGHSMVDGPTEVAGHIPACIVQGVSVPQVHMPVVGAGNGQFSHGDWQGLLLYGGCCMLP